MPFKSKEQERYLQINEPEIYRDWVEKYGHFKGAEGFSSEWLSRPIYQVCRTPHCSEMVVYHREADIGKECDKCVASTRYGKNQVCSVCEVEPIWSEDTDLCVGCSNNSELHDAESFGADEIVHCSFCSEIIGTEQEVYDEETVEWYNADGETVCPPCYKEWMKEWERDTDMHYTPFYAESFGAEPDTVRFKVGERYTPRYYHGYGHSDIEIIRRTDKSVFVAQVDAQGNAAGNTLRYKIYTTPAVDIGGDRFPAQEYYKLTHGQPVRAGDTTKKAESFRSYKVAPDLSSYTKAELVSSIAGPQGTAAYDEVVYDPLAQSRLSAESINSFSPARLIILGASIGVALGLYNTRGE